MNREPRGLRVDLSRGLYRYIEILTQREANTLNDWRDVADWLAQIDYKIQSMTAQNEDSLIKIVDISLRRSEDDPNLPIIDVKVRNVGSQVAFLKKARFLVYQAWVLHGLVSQTLGQKKAAPSAPGVAETARAAISRSVEPSYDYQFNLPKVAAYHSEFLEQIFSTDREKTPYVEEFDISQCVACNDGDRFTLTVTFPKEDLDPSCNTYKSVIYHFKLEICYNEDNRIVQSPNLILWLQPNSPVGETFYFLQEEFTRSLPSEIIREYSEHNKKVLAEIVKIDGIKSQVLNRFLSKVAALPELKESN
uniref:Uncharacterized protein n=1 Tax=Desertifilum tharense IPPAS B-1220 TaxID=1781255 RepID=A0ACD5GU46_9CYAN